MTRETEIQCNPLFPLYIENSRPNTDCIYCKVRHFVNYNTGKESAKQYAECMYEEKTRLTATDIVYSPSPFGYDTSCRNCKFYKSKNQLKLFEL